MIKYYYKSLRTAKIKELEDYTRGCWVHAENPSAHELEFLAQKFHLEPGLLEDAQDEYEMPRLEREGKQSYIFTRFAYQEKNGDFGTTPLLFVFGEEVLLTVSDKHLPSLENFVAGKIAFATTQRAKLVLQILQQIGEHYDGYISNTTKQIKSIRARLRGHTITNQDFVDFVTIEDELNEFQSSLLPTNATLRRLLLGRYIPLFEEDQDIVEDILLNNEQSIDACNSNMKSISNIREAYSAISGNNLNRTIKILTVLTVMLNIPNVLFQMYGMNVGLPYQEASWAFGGLIGLSIVLILVAAVIGRRKRIF
jgi:magnesium transporter